MDGSATPAVNISLAHFVQRLPEIELPVIEALEEICSSCVPCASSNKALRPALCQQIVAQSRNALVRADPIAVAAAEHAERDLCQFGPRETGEPFDKMGGVVGRLSCGVPVKPVPVVVAKRRTFERGCNNNNRTISGEIAYDGIKRSDRCIEAYGEFSYRLQLHSSVDLPCDAASEAMRCAKASDVPVFEPSTLR